MSQYLFLYPIEEYFENSLGFRGLEVRGITPSFLNDIIQARYRSRDYEVNWLFFAEEDGSDEPDTVRLPEYVDIKDEDRVLSNEISFITHCQKELYPDPDMILDKLPEHERLVLGGFHEGDCIAKVAKRSHERGVETFLDTDTTGNFMFAYIDRGIPLIRKDWSLESELSLDLSEEMDREHYDKVKEYRKDKPWYHGRDVLID